MCRLEDSMPPFLTALQFTSVQFSPVDHRPLPFPSFFPSVFFSYHPPDTDRQICRHQLMFISTAAGVSFAEVQTAASVQVQFSNLAFTFLFLFYPDINNSLETAAAAVLALCDRLMLCNEANEVGRKKERERE